MGSDSTNQPLWVKNAGTSILDTRPVAFPLTRLVISRVGLGIGPFCQNDAPPPRGQKCRYIDWRYTLAQPAISTPSSPAIVVVH